MSSLKYVLVASALLVLSAVYIASALIKQDKQLNFITPVKQFLLLTQEELSALSYPVRSIESFYAASDNVSKEEFSDYASVLFEHYKALTGIAYFGNEAFNSGAKKAEFWEATGISNATAEQAIHDATQLQMITKLAVGKAVTTPIFKEFDRNLIGVFYRMHDSEGVLLLLFDFEKAFRLVLDNKIAEDFVLHESVNGQRTLIYDHMINNNISFDSYASTLNFFDRDWEITVRRQFSPGQYWYLIIPLLSAVIAFFIFSMHKYSVRLSRLHKEKSEAIEQLKFAQDKIIESEKINAMGGLVAGISHEVNTPLGISITSSSHMKELLAELDMDFKNGVLDSDKFEDFLTTAKDITDLSIKNMQRASKLVASFKRVAVLNADDASQLEEVDITTLINDFIAAYRINSESNKIQFETQLPSSARIKTYPTVITQILSYLTSNTLIHAMRPGQQQCEITLTVTSSGSAYEFMFCDNGIGIDEQDLKKVFEPFFTTKRGAGNAGLGLSVVYNLIKSKLESDVHYDSVPGEGFCISFLLHDLN